MPLCQYRLSHEEVIRQNGFRHNTAIRIYETKMQTPAAKVLISAFLGQTVLPSKEERL